ncbi:MAG: hypothetical protein M1830_008248 [Pleopsidium flavum]|nr:MAG: hypothetical protein M1830_008248 [Pleopsidium flavum]
MIDDQTSAPILGSIGNGTRSGSDLEDIRPESNRRWSLRSNRRRSLGAVPLQSGSTIEQEDYKGFPPGDYVYRFELAIPNDVPETINVQFGTVKWELEARVERAGFLRSNLLGIKEISLIRAPGEDSLEQTEPIVHKNTWEDQLRYEIVVSGKSFPMGSQIPIMFSFTPLADVQCHRVEVSLTENVDRFTSTGKDHQLGSSRSIRLLERHADGTLSSAFLGSSVRMLSNPGIDTSKPEKVVSNVTIAERDECNSMLSTPEAEENTSTTKMEFMVQLPSCNTSNVKQRIHVDTTSTNIRVLHWIKVIVFLTQPDPDDSSKRKHRKICINFPFKILSCQVTPANLDLPAYTDPQIASISHDVGYSETLRRNLRRNSNAYTLHEPSWKNVESKDITPPSYDSIVAHTESTSFPNSQNY